MSFIQSIKNLPITAKASVSYIICNIIQKGLLILTLPIFTRLLTTDQYGQVVLYSSWRVLFTVLITLNVAFGSFPKAMLKYEDDRDGYVSTCQGVCLCLSILFLFIYLVFREYINILVELPTSIVIIMVLEIVAQSSISLLCAKKRFEYKYKDVIVVTLASSLFSPFLAYYLVRNFADKGFAMIIGYAIPTILVGFVVFIINLYKGKKLLTSKYCKYIIGLNVPLLVYYLSQMIFNHSDKIMISHITGTSDAALYGLAYNIAMVLTFVLDSVNGSYVPWLFERIKTKEYQKNKKISTMIAAGLSLMLLCIIWFAPEFVFIFGGEKYSASVYCIPALTISLLLLYYSQLFINTQFYYEDKKMLIVSSIFAALLNIILNYCLIPLYGFVVASYTTLFSYFVFALCNYFAVKNISKKDTNILNLYSFKYLIFICILFVSFSYLGVALYNVFYMRLLIALIVLTLLFIFRGLIYKLFVRDSND